MAEKAVSSMKTQPIQQVRHTGLERQQCFDLAVQVRELLTVLGLSFFGAIWRQWGWRKNDDTTSIDMIADSVKRWKAGAQKVFSAYCRPCQKPVWYERTDAIWGGGNSESGLMRGIEKLSPIPAKLLADPLPQNVEAA